MCVSVCFLTELSIYGIVKFGSMKRPGLVEATEAIHVASDPHLSSMTCI